MPSPTYAAHIDYVSAGTTNTFGVAFPYLEKTDVSVTVNGTITPFAWISDTTVQTLDADGNPYTPPSGATVRVQRNTPIAVPVVDFQDGSTLAAEDLAESDLQNLYAIQELSEKLAALQAQITSISITPGNLPPVTTGQNGYVLQVVGGVWTLVPTTAITVVIDEQVDGTTRVLQKKTQSLTVVGTPPAASSWTTIHTGTGC